MLIISVCSATIPLIFLIIRDAHARRSTVLIARGHSAVGWMMKIGIRSIFALALLASHSIQAVHGLVGEFDRLAVCERVIDGDTFEIVSGDRIRLADIDAPESYEEGYQEAMDYLIDLIYEETVYLDIDDIYETDIYGRYVCVVYIRHNSAHYKNINEALLAVGHAVISNYYNEFNPYNWILYVHEDTIPYYSYHSSCRAHF